MQPEIKKINREYNAREHFIRNKVVVYVEGNTDKSYFEKINVFNKYKTIIRVPSIDVKNNKIDVKREISNLANPKDGIGIVDLDTDQAENINKKRKYPSLFYTDCYDLEMTVLWTSNRLEIFNSILDTVRKQIGNITQLDFEEVIRRTFILASWLGRLRIWLVANDYHGNWDQIKLAFPEENLNSFKDRKIIHYFELIKKDFVISNFLTNIHESDIDFEKKVYEQTFIFFQLTKFKHITFLKSLWETFLSSIKDRGYYRNIINNELLFKLSNTHLFIDLLIQNLSKNIQSSSEGINFTSIRSDIEYKIRNSSSKETFKNTNLFKMIQAWQETFNSYILFI